MIQASLQLIDYWTTSLHVDANPDFEPSKERELNCDLITVDHRVTRVTGETTEGQPSRWHVDLTIEQTIQPEQNAPYSFRIVMQGVVIAHPRLSGAQLERAVAANGPAMLFGAAREVIRAATGRGPHAALLIPSTHFLANLPPPETAPAKPAKKAARKTTKKAVKKSAKKAPRKKD